MEETTGQEQTAEQQEQTAEQQKKSETKTQEESETKTQEESETKTQEESESEIQEESKSEIQEESESKTEEEQKESESKTEQEESELDICTIIYTVSDGQGTDSSGQQYQEILLGYADSINHSCAILIALSLAVLLCTGITAGCMIARSIWDRFK